MTRLLLCLTLACLPVEGEILAGFARRDITPKEPVPMWGYGARHDIARVPLQVDTLDSPVERFTIRVDTVRARLVLEWGTFRWSAPIDS